MKKNSKRYKEILKNAINDKKVSPKEALELVKKLPVVFKGKTSTIKVIRNGIKNKKVKIIYLLDELNKDKYSKFILRHLANDNIEKGSEIFAAELATNISRYDFAIQIAKLASYEKRFINNFFLKVIDII